MMRRHGALLTCAVLAAAALQAPGPAAAVQSSAAQSSEDSLVLTSRSGAVWQTDAAAEQRVLLTTARDTTGAARLRTQVSPDGSRIAYLTESGQLRVAGVRGGPVSVVAAGDEVDAPVMFRWTPDGQHLLVTLQDQLSSPSEPSLAVVTVDPPAVERIAGTRGLSEAAAHPVDPELLVAAGPTGLVTKRPGAAPVPLQGPLAQSAHSPAWRPDGGALAWGHTVTVPSASGVQELRQQVVLAAADGSRAKVVLDSPDDTLSALTWSPDGGSLYAFTDPDTTTPGGSLWRVPMDGSEARLLDIDPDLLSGLNNVLSATPPPANPGPTGATAVTDLDVVRLSWKTPPGTQVQAVRYIGPFATGPATSVPVLPAGNRLVDRNVQPGSTYTYALIAVAPDGTRSEPTLVPVVADAPPAFLTGSNLATWGNEPAFIPAFGPCGQFCNGEAETLQWARVDTRTGTRGPWRSADPAAVLGRGKPVVLRPGSVLDLRISGRDEFGNSTGFRTRRFVAPLDQSKARFSAGWRSGRKVIDGHWLGTFARTERGGETATLRFHGTAVTVMGEKGPTGGEFDVVLDGRRLGRFSTYRGNPLTTQELRVIRGLRRGPHVLTLRTVASPERSSFLLDAFAVWP